VETDLADAATAARLFNSAEGAFGPVDILINNASGWVPDTFSPTPQERFGHQQVRAPARRLTVSLLWTREAPLCSSQNSHAVTPLAVATGVE
jgi:NAD(P)-dependent dehydrogenase (short-subunit alcohol dehydrogenase family)